MWQALTDGEITSRYWGGRRIVSDWQVGSPVKHSREDGGIHWQGEVLQWVPPPLLSYAFHMLISGQHRQERSTRVTFELQPMKSFVKLTLTHDDFDAMFEMTRHGWPASMSSLKRILETGRPLPLRA